MADHILIGDIEPRISYVVGSTPQTAFDVPFPFFEDTDLAVYVDGVIKVLATDYTVAGAGADSGGTVTFTSGQSDCRVSLVQDIPIARTTDYPTSGPFQIGALNTDIDKLTAWMQAQRSRLDRCIRPPDGDPDGLYTLPALEVRANRYMGFDSNGLPVPMVDAGGYPASDYGAGLISAIDAAAARIVLGLTVAGSALVMAADLAAQRALLGSLTHFAAGAALPSTNIGPIWHADYASVMAWQVFNANGASYTGYASVGVGKMTADLLASPRTGELKLNGSDLSTTTYAPLYHWAKHNGLVVASGSWTASTNKFRENGGGTFRVPDLRGEFIRAAADGGSVDSGRATGSAQGMALETHIHTAQQASFSGLAGADAGTGYSFASGNTSAPTTGTIGSETRPRNVALLHVIKF